MLYSTFYMAKFAINKNLIFDGNDNNSIDKEINPTESPEIPSIIPDIPVKEIHPEEEVPNKTIPEEEIDPKNIPEIELPNEDEVPKVTDYQIKKVH